MTEDEYMAGLSVKDRNRMLLLEAKAAAISNKRNVILNFEKEIEKAIYRDEKDAEDVALERSARFNDYFEPEGDSDEDLVD